jgi:hypothetical protein
MQPSAGDSSHDGSTPSRVFVIGTKICLFVNPAVEEKSLSFNEFRNKTRDVGQYSEIRLSTVANSPVHSRSLPRRQVAVGELTGDLA